MIIIFPFCRLGNNLIQLHRALTMNIRFLHHDTLDISQLKRRYPTILKNFPSVYKFNFPQKKEKIVSRFWYAHDYEPLIKNKTPSTDITDKQVIDKYILPYIDKNINKNLCNNIDFDKDLIIHIRSGDVTPMLDKYIQPPLSFYENIIHENNYRNIHIITENKMLNPVVKILQNKYKNVFFSPRNFDEDFSILINAKYLVVSNSTLSKWLCRLNKNLKIVYSNCGWAHEKGEYEVKFTNTPSYYQLKFQNYQEKEDAILKYKI